MGQCEYQLKRNWSAWHKQYEDELSPLRRRLSIVQGEIRRALPTELERPFSVVSICAGQGNDLVPVLQAYPFAQQVHARLVECDPDNIDGLRSRSHSASLNHLEIVHADAAHTGVYSGIAPADLILLCGVFGNISDADIQDTIAARPNYAALGQK